MMKKIKIIVMLFLGMMVIPVSALAFDIKGGETLEIGKDEVIEDDLLIAGATVRINGQVNGDVKAVGSIIEINGTVNGDVVAAGSQITIRGEVADDLYVAGAQVSLENKIGDNVFISGGTINISENSEIGRDLRVYSGMVSIDGEVKRNIDGGAGQLNITNNVNGYIKGDFDKLTIGPGVQIAGDIVYSSPNQVEIDSSANVSGIVDWTKTEAKTSQKSNGQYNIWGGSMVLSIIWQIIKIISLIILGLVLLWLFPKEIKKLTDRLADDPGNSILWGLLVCIVTPIIAIGLLFTVVGIPLSVIMIALYTLALYLAKILVSLWLGRSLLLSLSKKKNVSQVWSIVFGALMIGLLFAVPVIGFLARIIVVLFGVGAIFMSLRNYFAKRK